MEKHDVHVSSPSCPSKQYKRRKNSTKKESQKFLVRILEKHDAQHEAKVSSPRCPSKRHSILSEAFAADFSPLMRLLGGFFGVA